MLKPSVGLSLVEVMVALTITMLIMMAALPAFGSWSADFRVRSAADSIKAGVDLARMEAIKRNMVVSFRLQPSALRLWEVGCDSSLCPSMLQAAPAAETGKLSISAASDSGVAASSLSFDGLGRPADSTGLRSVTVSTPGGSRSLLLRIGAGGATRICNAAQAGSAACA
jgi:type IV fimbrial biogenesis protein FimT